MAEVEDGLPSVPVDRPGGEDGIPNWPAQLCKPVVQKDVLAAVAWVLD